LKDEILDSVRKGGKIIFNKCLLIKILNSLKLVKCLMLTLIFINSVTFVFLQQRQHKFKLN